jgi:GTP-binding protein
VVIVVARHPLTPLDQQLLGWFMPSNQPVLVLLTKADKLNRQEQTAALRASQALLQSRHPNANAQLFSAVTGTGVKTAQSMLYDWLK